jgi:cytochrome oxidase assembly protein ShyY1
MQVIRSGMSWFSSIPRTWLQGVNCEISQTTRKGLFTLSAFSLFMLGVEESRKQAVYSLIALKKERLAMPVYELKGEELYNFPWNHDNLDEWLYRPVKVTGRPIYRQLIRPRVFQGYTPGYHLITPIVTDEAEDLHPDTRKGVLLNQGWCPAFTLRNLIFFDEE